LNSRPAAAVGRARTVVQQFAGWTLQDTIGVRAADIAQVLSDVVFNGAAQAGAFVGTWNAFAAALPLDMTLEEMLAFLAADDEAEQRQVLEAVNTRLRVGEEQAAI